MGRILPPGRPFPAALEIPGNPEQVGRPEMLGDLVRLVWECAARGVSVRHPAWLRG